MTRDERDPAAKSAGADQDGGGASACCGGNSSCAPPAEPADPVSRRRFLELSALTAGVGISSSLVATERAVAVPADKRLSSEWIGSLTRRGSPTVYTDAAALRHIGMPVGGMTSGQLYLGGDGKLWLWDIFNPRTAPVGGTVWTGPHYADPVEPVSPFRSGFALRTRSNGQTRTRALDAGGFSDIRFSGQYPIGRVQYRADDSPVQVDLEAFSPFVPLEADDSSLPATVLVYTVTNATARTVEAEIAGWSESAICLESRSQQPIRLHSAERNGAAFASVSFSAEAGEVTDPRPDIIFDDFERDDYARWTVEGEAFGAGPVAASEVPDYMRRFGDLNVHGSRFVTSHHFRAGGDAVASDSYRGRLTSQPFRVERRYIRIGIGGGDWRGQTCVNVLVDGEVVESVTGSNAEPLTPRTLDVHRFEGREAVIEIVDDHEGGWGHVNCDHIVFTDRPADPKPLDQLPDAGTFAVAALESDAQVNPSLPRWDTPEDVFATKTGPTEVDASERTLAGAVRIPVTLGPNESRTVRFVVGWHFPLPRRDKFSYLRGADSLKHYYSTRFGSAAEVVDHVATHRERLESGTRKWVRTWYEDSTLPYWFLERTLATASTLATNVCYRFHEGRFYGWEGVYCCAGTCEHVWNYAQSVARLFPALERDTRERVDFGIAFHPDTGALDYRAEADQRVAHDGQCGTILRVYREHQMSTDDAFLRRVWPRVKKAVQFMIRHDGEPDGTLEAEQYNTLDATWYGEIPWISGLYVASLRAAERMATEMGDAAFAGECGRLAKSGSSYLADALWNDTYGYFIHRVDPQHPDSTNSNRGCYIDQMYGQNYAHQLGLPRIFPVKKTRTGLRNIYRNNFTPDPAQYREESKIPGGRVFAMANEPGLLMCTWPYGGAEEAPGTGEAFAVGYFDENWTGTEYQAAAHMLAEGLVEEGLTVTRAVHDRYDAAKRNPYNEIECSDHYVRAMMSYGVYLAACGYEHHGPQGHLGFSPRFQQDEFAAAFTAAGGWGLYRQRRRTHRQDCTIEVRHGQVAVRTLTFETPWEPRAVTAHVDGQRREVSDFTVRDGHVEIALAQEQRLEPGQSLELRISGSGGREG